MRLPAVTEPKINVHLKPVGLRGGPSKEYKIFLISMLARVPEWSYKLSQGQAPFPMA